MGLPILLNTPPSLFLLYSELSLLSSLHQYSPFSLSLFSTPPFPIPPQFPLRICPTPANPHVAPDKLRCNALTLQRMATNNCMVSNSTTTYGNHQSYGIKLNSETTHALMAFDEHNIV